MNEALLSDPVTEPDTQLEGAQEGTPASDTEREASEDDMVCIPETQAEDTDANSPLFHSQRIPDTILEQINALALNLIATHKQVKSLQTWLCLPYPR